MSKYVFFKNAPSDKVWWVEEYPESSMQHIFTFDKKKLYYLFKDYPNALTKQEKDIFDKENPFWADFFKDRNV